MTLTPQQVINLIQKAIQSLALRTNDYEHLLRAQAEAERTYDMAYASEVLRLKQSGEPATIIPTLAKGTKHVADLKFDLAIADALVKASDKSMKNLDSALVGYNSILSWEKKTYGEV